MYNCGMSRERGESFSIEAVGAVIRGTRFGRGPTVVLLHGGPGCYDYFSGTALVAWLAESHSVWCYDQRGCCVSESTGPYTMAANVEDLEALRRHIGDERMILLGHSAGAVLGAHYTAEHGSRVEKLILVGPAGARPGWHVGFDQTLRKRQTTDQRAALLKIDRLLLATRDRSARSELYRRRFNVMLPSYVDPRHRELAPKMAHYHRDVNVGVGASILALHRKGTWEAGLRTYDRPAAVIHGRSDPIPWHVVHDWCELLPQSVVYSVEHCGHFPWLEEPEAFRGALFAFLGGSG